MMTRVTALAAVVLGAGITSSWVHAQYYAAAPVYSPSTAGESHARGMADVVRSAGAANLMNSEASKNYEQARSMDYDNRLKWTETYFDMQRVNKSYRDAKRPKRLTPDQYNQIAKAKAPARTSSSQLDPLTGQLAWPMALQESRYEPFRSQLEPMFSKRAYQHGNIGPDGYREIQATVDACLAELKQNIRDYRPNDYLAAKKFLESLGHEAGFPTS